MGMNTTRRTVYTDKSKGLAVERCVIRVNWTERNGVDKYRVSRSRTIYNVVSLSDIGFCVQVNGKLDGIDYINKS